MLRHLILILATIFLTTTALPSTLIPRDVPYEDSITYCSLKSRLEQGDPLYTLPCTKKPDPNSEVEFYFPSLNTLSSKKFAAHFECYLETEWGMRYFAGHAASGAEPCWLSASDLGPTDYCIDNSSPSNATCWCERAQLASCCAFPGAGAVGVDSYLNATYLTCP